MTIAIGDSIPDLTVSAMTDGSPTDISSRELLGSQSTYSNQSLLQSSRTSPTENPDAIDVNSLMVNGISRIR